MLLRQLRYTALSECIYWTKPKNICLPKMIKHGLMVSTFAMVTISIAHANEGEE